MINWKSFIVVKLDGFDLNNSAAVIGMAHLYGKKFFKVQL